MGAPSETPIASESIATPNGAQAPTEIDILLREYDYAQKRMHAYIDQFHRHEIAVNLSLSAGVALISAFRVLGADVIANIPCVVFALCCFYACLNAYLITLGASLTYNIIQHGANARCIQNRNNDFFDRPILVWDTSMLVHGGRTTPLDPAVLKAVLAFILAGIGLFLAGSIVWEIGPLFFWPFIVVSVGLLIGALFLWLYPVLRLPKRLIKQLTARYDGLAEEDGMNRDIRELVHAPCGIEMEREPSGESTEALQAPMVSVGGRTRER